MAAVESRILLNKDKKLELLSRSNCKCAHCGKKLDIDSMTVEHIYPLNKGGTNDDYNLTVLCKKCNNEKSNMIYSIDQYYRYINKEYRLNYILCNSKIREKVASKAKRPRIIDYDTMIYEGVTPQGGAILCNMIKRNVSKKRIRSMIDRVTLKFRLERAYEADAIRILKFMEQNQPSEMYDNEYSILNDIKNGEVYIFKSNDSIFGAIIFKRLEQSIEGLQQLDNLIENTGFREKYILTYIGISNNVAEYKADIMRDLIYEMIPIGIYPLAFNVDFEGYETIKLPYNICGNEGLLGFLTLKGLRELLKDRLMNMIGFKNKTEDVLALLDEYTDLLVYKHNSNEDDIELLNAKFTETLKVILNLEDKKSEQ